MGQPGLVGAVVKGIQERELLPVGVFLGALHWLFCAALFCDWLIDDFDIDDKGLLEQWKRPGVGDAAEEDLLRFSAT